jgi:hypothetical protein
MLTAQLLALVLSATPGIPCPDMTEWVTNHVCNVAEFRAANAVLRRVGQNRRNSSKIALNNALTTCGDLDCVRAAYSDALSQTLPSGVGCGGPNALKNERGTNTLEIGARLGRWRVACLDLTNGNTANEGTNFSETMIVGMAEKRSDGSYWLMTYQPQCEVSLQRVSAIVWRVHQSATCSFGADQNAEGTYRNER